MAGSLGRKSSGSQLSSNGGNGGMSSRHSSISSMSNPTGLLDNYAKFNVSYMGLVADMGTEMDPTARTSLLKTMDQGIAAGTVSEEGEAAVLWINAYSVRILASNQQLLFCAPVHMIVSVGLVKEEGLNIIGMKIGEVGGNKELFDLALFLSPTTKEAELICRLLAQSFQLVFNEATAALLEKKETEGVGWSWGRAGEDVSFMRSFMSGSHRVIPSTSHSGSHSDRLSSQSAADEAAASYIRILQSLLSMEEMKAFAILMKRWREAGIPFLEFCQKVLELLGQERKHLLARMRPFVADKDAAAYQGFLEQSGVSDNAADSLPSHSPVDEASSSADINSIRLFPTPSLPHSSNH